MLDSQETLITLTISINVPLRAVFGSAHMEIPDKYHPKESYLGVEISHALDGCDEDDDRTLKFLDETHPELINSIRKTREASNLLMIYLEEKFYDTETGKYNEKLKAIWAYLPTNKHEVGAFVWAIMDKGFCYVIPDHVPAQHHVIPLENGRVFDEIEMFDPSFARLCREVEKANDELLAEIAKLDRYVKRDEEILNLSIENLGLSVRALNMLKRHGLRRVSELVALNESQLMQIKNFGQELLKEVKANLGHLGLRIRR